MPHGCRRPRAPETQREDSPISGPACDRQAHKFARYLRDEEPGHSSPLFSKDKRERKTCDLFSERMVFSNLPLSPLRPRVYGAPGLRGVSLRLRVSGAPGLRSASVVNLLFRLLIFNPSDNHLSHPPDARRPGYSSGLPSRPLQHCE